MIAPGSLIGFALLFLLSTWLLSGLGVLVLRLCQPQLRRRGAGAEKRAAELALFLPPILGAILSLTLAGFSLAAPALGFGDHCLGTGHTHLHLCLLHASEWQQKDWALVLTIIVALVLSYRLATLALQLWRGRRQLRQVERNSSLLHEDRVPVLQAPSARPFCFLAGIRRPRIYVASSLWDLLGDEERRAMLEHEQVHLENRDLLRGVLITMSAALAAPLAARFAKELWDDATERLCDRVAADRTGEPEALASALLRLLRGWQQSPGMALVPNVHKIESRIVSLLSQEESGEGLARQLSSAACVLVVALAVTTATLANPLHHAFETLIGSI